MDRAIAEFAVNPDFVQSFFAGAMREMEEYRHEFVLEGIGATTLPEDLTSEVFESIGRASMCWVQPPEGRFDSEQAGKIGDRLCDAIQDAIDAVREEERPRPLELAAAFACMAAIAIGSICALMAAFEFLFGK